MYVHCTLYHVYRHDCSRVRFPRKVVTLTPSHDRVQKIKRVCKVDGETWVVKLKYFRWKTKKNERTWLTTNNPCWKLTYGKTIYTYSRNIIKMRTRPIEFEAAGTSQPRSSQSPIYRLLCAKTSASIENVIKYKKCVLWYACPNVNIPYVEFIGRILLKSQKEFRIIQRCTRVSVCSRTRSQLYCILYASFLR